MLLDAKAQADLVPRPKSASGEIIDGNGNVAGESIGCFLPSRSDFVREIAGMGTRRQVVFLRPNAGLNAEKIAGAEQQVVLVSIRASAEEVLAKGRFRLIAKKSPLLISRPVNGW